MLLTTFLISLTVIIMISMKSNFGIRKLYMTCVIWALQYVERRTEKCSENLIKEDNVEEIESKLKGRFQYRVNRRPIIKKQSLTLLPQSVRNCCEIDNLLSENKLTMTSTNFKLDSCFEYLTSGVEAIIEDEVTTRFVSKELDSWNLLRRTWRRYILVPWDVKVIYFAGFVLRYFFLLPMRILLCSFGLCWFGLVYPLVGYLPHSEFRRILAKASWYIGMRAWSSSFSAVITYHNPQNKPKNGSICITNHSTPIDTTIASCDHIYSLVGLQHKGIIGIVSKGLNRVSSHIWFKREKKADRSDVIEKLKIHISDNNNPPVLMFSEGTCVNNTAVMQFNKGTFELDTVFYPMAINYDSRFCDPFYNSFRHIFAMHLFTMMTSWALVCDVTYLPPMERREGESVSDFTDRVKQVLAGHGEFDNVPWSGQLKRKKPKDEWKEKQQRDFAVKLQDSGAL